MVNDRLKLGGDLSTRSLIALQNSPWKRARTHKGAHYDCSLRQIKLVLDTIRSVYMSTQNMHTVYNHNPDGSAKFGHMKTSCNIVFSCCQFPADLLERSPDSDSAVSHTGPSGFFQ